MDYYFYDETDQENDLDDEHDVDSSYQVQMRCLSKARQSCNEMLEALRQTVLEEEELTISELEARHSSSIRSALLLSNSVYRDLNARCPINKILGK